MKTIKEIDIRKEAKEANLMEVIEEVTVAINRSGARTGDRDIREEFGPQEEMI